MRLEIRIYQCIQQLHVAEIHVYMQDPGVDLREPEDETESFISFGYTYCDIDWCVFGIYLETTERERD